jgi:hypothetical protein
LCSTIIFINNKASGEDISHTFIFNQSEQLESSRAFGKDCRHVMERKKAVTQCRFNVPIILGRRGKVNKTRQPQSPTNTDHTEEEDIYLITE